MATFKPTFNPTVQSIGTVARAPNVSLTTQTSSAALAPTPIRLATSPTANPVVVPTATAPIRLSSQSTSGSTSNVAATPLFQTQAAPSQQFVQPLPLFSPMPGPAAAPPLQTGLTTGPVPPESSLPNFPATPIGPVAIGPTAMAAGAIAAAAPFVPPPSDGTSVAASAPFPDAPFAAPAAQGPSPDDSQQWNDPGAAAVIPVASTTAAATPIPGLPATSTATTTVVAPSLWTRFLTWLGFIKPATASTVHGDPVEQAAGSIVRRVCNGDQNAMGLMVMIRENAINGDPVAQKTYEYMRSYVNAGHEPSKYQPYNLGHEPSKYQPYNLGHEGMNSGWAKAVSIANGERLMTNDTIGKVASHFGEEHEADHFLSGVALPTYPAVSAAHHHGKVVGMARKIQAVRMPGSRISDYSATVGWELGE